MRVQQQTESSFLWGTDSLYGLGEHPLENRMPEMTHTEFFQWGSCNGLLYIWFHHQAKLLHPLSHNLKFVLEAHQWIDKGNWCDQKLYLLPQQLDTFVLMIRVHVPSHPNRYCPTQMQISCLPSEVAQLDQRNACQFLPGLYTYWLWQAKAISLEPVNKLIKQKKKGINERKILKGFKEY